MKKTAKKVLIVIFSVVVAIHFLGNVLPNLIGVPLAFYHSYRMEQEREDHNIAIEHSEHAEAVKDSIQSKKRTE